MYLCYLDESGVQEDSGTSHFVLLGLAIPDGSWKQWDTQIAGIKRPFGLESAELHTAWMTRRYIEQERIPGFEGMDWEARRSEVDKLREGHLLRVAAHGTQKQLKEAKKNYRKTYPYVHLTHEQRLDLIRQVADTIAGWQDARLFAEANDKRATYRSGNPPAPPFEFSFAELVQRFEYFLRHKGRSMNQTLQGLIIQDNNETIATRLTTMMRRFHRTGTRWADIDHIVETPLFVDSQLTSMVQLADLCAYATRRFFENAETDLFDRIYDRFDRTSRGVVGIRHYTTPGCVCRVCRDHV